MDRTAFASQLQQGGYDEVVERDMAAGTVNPSHTHEFDAQVFVLDGEITILRDGGAQTYRGGEWCELPAGTVHEERVGSLGVRYIAGRRRPPDQA